PVRRRPSLLMATPPYHESALVLGHVRECFSPASLANSRLAGYQHQLAPPGKHAGKCSPENIELARPAGDESMRILTAAWGRIVHAALSLQRITNLALRCRRPGASAQSAGCLSQDTCVFQSAKLPFGLFSHAQTCSS